jgi:hypothetical protein
MASVNKASHAADVAPPPEDPVDPPPLVGPAVADCTLTSEVVVPVAPPLSVTVRLTVTDPGALVAKVAVRPVVAPTQDARVAPAVMRHS